MGEAGVIRFAEFFVIFWVFQPNGEADNNALSIHQCHANFKSNETLLYYS
jgi:hypothetical protein